MRAPLLARVGLLLLLAALALPSAQAHAGNDDVLLVAREEGCPDGRTFCFEVVAGDITAIDPGDNLTITLRNEGSSVHNVYLAPLANATPGAQTQAEAAFAHTEDLETGEQATLKVQVPEDLEVLYLWCDISGHERLGMWLRTDQAPDHAPSTEAPLGAWSLIVALGVAAVVAGSRKVV